MRSQSNGKTSLRCAIYTRKSSEEGLELDFNSLDAQREACEAFITSQKHEGWSVLDNMYDDGGISGGTMERPALKRLLEHIEAGKIDSVVVYKVDRLSRSLSDFVKMVEIFDGKGVSFVSVTQQFNTTTSMGRLTLNMLLSFAQFEREVTGERIRDKIAASKRKGMWMGGLPPLGFDVLDRKLVINEVEAGTVNHIYQRYLELGSVRLLKEDLDRDDVVSKQRVNKHGRASGGKPIARGALYLMLSNRLYLGEIVHKDKSYSGEHESIISIELWSDVQALLTTNRVNRKTGANTKNPSLLAGLLFDDDGERMIPSHAKKKGKSYRYYISKTLLTGSRDSGQKGRRLPAGDIEWLVERYLMQLLKGPAELHKMMEPHIPNALERQSLIVTASQLAAKWPRMGTSAKRHLLNDLIARIDIKTVTVEMQIRPHQLPLSLAGKDAPNPACSTENAGTLTISVPARLKRAGLETKLVIEENNALGRKGPDTHLLQRIAKAHQFQAIFLRGDQSIAEMANEAGVSSSYFTRTLRLSFLAPDITKAILAGTQPVQLTVHKLKSYRRMPMLWSEQRCMFDFA